MSEASKGEGPLPPTEVSARAVRRQFTAQYKLRIVQEADLCTNPGERGALLRREGLYSSHLTNWRRLREQGELDGLAPRRRGPRPKRTSAADRRVRTLEKENRRLLARAEQAEALVEIQKKVSQLLGINLPEADETA